MTRYITPTATGALHPLQDSPRGDSQNCVVRTYANCMDIGYQTAHEIFAGLGRKNHSGMIFPDYVDQFIDSGFSGELFFHSRESAIIHEDCSARGMKVIHDKLTLGGMMKNAKYQRGNYAVLIKGHIFNLRNGKIYDTSEPMAAQTQVVCIFEKA